MFYIHSSGIVTINANTSVTLNEQFFTSRHIKLDRLTAMVESTTPAGAKEDIYVNWRPQGGDNTIDWEFDRDYVPLDMIYGTPQYPYILSRNLELEDNYIDFKIFNNNAFNVTLCIAFIGKLIDPNDRKINKSLLERPDYKFHNYQIEEGVVGSGINVSRYGVATIPAGVVRAQAFFRNDYGSAFRINQLWQWLRPAVDISFNMRLEDYSIPLTSNNVYVDQIFGSSDQRFDLKEDILMDFNEKLIMEFDNPMALANDISLNFGGDLYYKGKYF